MKKITFTRTGTPVMALVLALVLAGCPADTGGGSTNNNSNGNASPNDNDQSQGANGSLTITGIPAKFNNKYIVCMAENFGQEYNLYAAEKADEETQTVTLGRISSGTANVSVWKEANNEGEIYTGSDKNVPFTFYIFPKQTMTNDDMNDVSVLMTLMTQGGAGKATVDFTSGKGTCRFTEVSVADLIGF